MLCIYRAADCPAYLDKQAKKLFAEGMAWFDKVNLDQEKLIEVGADLLLFPWKGDKIVYTLAAIFRNKNRRVGITSGVIQLTKCTKSDFFSLIDAILAEGRPIYTELTKGILNISDEKFDPFLSRELQELNYSAKFFDIDGAWAWLQSLSQNNY